MLQTLSAQGFCKPPDLDDSKDGEDPAESVGGVGLGEGSGSQNVSKDIEDESQVEGLRGDGQQDTMDNKGGKDAIEMSDDFGGDMEDIPDTESKSRYLKLASCSSTNRYRLLYVRGGSLDDVWCRFTPRLYVQMLMKRLQTMTFSSAQGHVTRAAKSNLAKS